MTVGTTSGRQFTVGQIVARAYRYAGLLESSQEPKAADRRLGRDLLEDIVDALATDGVQARAMGFEEVTLTSGTYKYTLSSTALEVLDPGMYIAASETDTDKAAGETIVTLIDQREWHRYSAKDASGRPSRMYAHRVGDEPQVWFWPIPDEAGTVRLRVHLHLADVDDDNATLDLQPYWMDYIKTELAHQLAEAKSLPADKVMRLASKARESLRKCKGRANERPGIQIVVHHPTGYGRRR